MPDYPESWPRPVRTLVRRLAAASAAAAIALMTLLPTTGVHAAPGTSAASNPCPPTSVPASFAHVRQVPADYPSIQAAVNAAQPGDLVSIAPGVYHEAVNV